MSCNGSFKCCRTQAVQKSCRGPFPPSPGRCPAGMLRAGRKELGKAVGPEPGWMSLIPVTHSKPSFPFRYSCWGSGGALPGGRAVPLNWASPRVPVPSSGCVLWQSWHWSLLTQSWAQLIIHKSHKWIPLAFSSIRLGWGSHTGRNFATWLERIKPGATSSIWQQCLICTWS